MDIHNYINLMTRLNLSVFFFIFADCVCGDVVRYFYGISNRTHNTFETDENHATDR